MLVCLWNQYSCPIPTCITNDQSCRWKNCIFSNSGIHLAWETKYRKSCYLSILMWKTTFFVSKRIRFFLDISTVFNLVRGSISVWTHVVCCTKIDFQSLNLGTYSLRYATNFSNLCFINIEIRIQKLSFIQ